MESSSAEFNLDDLLAKAIEHHREGELTQAEWVYQELLEQAPDHPDVNHLIGVLAHQMGNTKLAIERVTRSLQIRPDQPGALNNLGNMYAAVERAEEAIESYRRAIELKPDYADALHNLGNVLSDHDQIAESLECFQRAAELNPDDSVSWTAYGTASEKIGQFEQAIEAYRTALEIEPACQQTLSRLGAVLRKLDRLDEAERVYQRWLEINPDHPVAQHLHQACAREGQTPSRATVEYVRATFDAFAGDFDSCLRDLGYRVPELLGNKAQELLADSDRADNSVVDLGCGTGLCGPYLREQAATLIGVDLSAAMLAQADARQIDGRNVYDELIEADLVDYLRGCDRQHDLILSADTLLYLGDLRETFNAALIALRPGGGLLFSVEKLDADAPMGYRLHTSGRYQHTRACIEDWLRASGFAIAELVEATLRQEGYDSIRGYLVTAIKPDDVGPAE